MAAVLEPSPAVSSSAPVAASASSPTTPGASEPHQSTHNNQFEPGGPAVSSPVHLSQAPPRKRRRIVISCVECHRRKQKCDRSLPCSKCVERKAEHKCRYDENAPTVTAASGLPDGDKGGPPMPKKRKPRASKYDVGVDVRRDVASSRLGVVPDSGAGGASMQSSSTNFGYLTAGVSTLGLLRRIVEDGEATTVAGAAAPLPSLAMGLGARMNDGTTYFGTRERYKSLVRQLPARPYIEKLVDVFFKEVDWQYNGIDKYVFDRQMDEWFSLPFHVLNTEGPQAFPPDLRAFPALLFQMIATGLLMLGTGSGSGSDPAFDSLKYNASMTFDDLATDYSDSGVSLLTLLGKRDISHTAVLADWLRAGFLKYSGLVTESWHAIGTAIRDAQEAGLHLDSLDPKPKSDSIEDVLENQWEIQRRRKTWCILMCWDVHTGVVLGRPTSIDLRVPYTLPVDAPTPKDPTRTPVTQRTESDPPSLMTRTLHVFRVMIALHEIKELEKEGPCPKDFSKVDRLHATLLDLEAQTPACFRKQNPDTRYDDLPEYFWIPLVRSQLHPLVWFNVMALHRPYVFTRQRSRTEALKASLRMLEAQRQTFASVDPRHHNTFQLFFGTFDAVVLMAAIFILFPKDNAEYVTAALQHFQWAVERFETMAERNRLAAAARSVLYGIHARLKIARLGAKAVTSVAGAESSQSIGKGTQHSSSSAETSAQGSSNQPYFKNSTSLPSNSIGTSSNPGGGAHSPPSVDEHYLNGGVPIDPSLQVGDGAQAEPQQYQNQSDWALPEGFGWGSIQPVYAMGDLAYNDLTASNSRAGASMPNWAGGAPLLNEGLAPGGLDPHGWSFGGDFGSDSVWHLLNQCPAEFRG